MAAGDQIAEFFATLGLKVKDGDIKKFDKTLDRVEERAKKFAEGSLGNIRINISGFGFSEDFNRRMHVALKRRLSVISNKSISPEIRITKFDIDKSALLAEMRDAVRYVENNLRVNLRTGVTHPTGAFTGQRAMAGGLSRFGTGLGFGAAAGGLGRGFIPGLGVAFGISQMNRLNQELIGQDLAASAVFGGPAQGQEQLDWLRNLGNKIGFDYRSQANAYLKMQAAATTAGMDISGGQQIFTSMAEYGRVMGLSDEDMKGSMRAVEQMLNKGQVYAEELKMQLGEKFPAAIQLMAEAVAGGDTEKLFKMMEKGEVKSLEALPRFAEILSRQARVGGALEDAMKTSLAEQMRFNNSFNDMILTFSKAGFEEGQAGIFKTMRDFMEEMLPLVEGFGEAWGYVGDLLRVPLGLLADLSTGLQAFSEYTGIAKGNLVALGSTLALLAFPFTRIATVIFIALAALEDFTGFLSGRQSLIGYLLGDDSEATRTNILNLFSTLATLTKTVFDRLSDIFSLLNSTDIGWISFLNKELERLERLLDAINVALGGESRASRESRDIPEYIRRGIIEPTGMSSVVDIAKNLEPGIISQSGIGDWLWKNITPVGMLGEGMIPIPLLGQMLSADSPYAADTMRVGGESNNFSNIEPYRQPISIGNMEIRLDNIQNPEDFANRLSEYMKETYAPYAEGGGQ